MINSLREQLEKKGELVLDLRLVPRRAQNEWLEVMSDGSLKLAIKAAPEGGAANRALLKFLAQEFTLGLGQIKILTGETARHKLVRLVK